MTGLEGAIKGGEKRYPIAFDYVEEKTRMVEEFRKTFLKETEGHAEALKVLQNEVAGLKLVLRDFLQRTIQDVLRVRERVVE